METVEAAPQASALIESLRDIGYSLETAIADIIDNSITAESKNIDIFVDASEADARIAIIDDGYGMSREELLTAMRPGSQNPLDNRDENDLGRFGLGLKTASFSQCRCLTVVTRKNGVTSAARWDLDYVEKENKWLILVPDEKELKQIPHADKLLESGTLVVWERMDRVIDQTSGTQLKDYVYERIDIARRHLELVFHRFLSGERSFQKVHISINGDKLVAFDPFHSRHAATIHLQEERIPIEGHNVIVQPYILPHHKKVTAKEWEKYAGEGGYLKNQGFYVYRGGRLIIHGTWFRLNRQTELTKLARVRVDMPNGLDHLWKIDVKKASAQPPYVVRRKLKNIIDRIAGASGRVYTFRGHKINNSKVTSIWFRRIDKNEISYEVNKDHPTIMGFSNSLNSLQKSQLNSVIKVVEKSFPTDALFADIASSPESVSKDEIDEETLRQLIQLMSEVIKEQTTNFTEMIERFKMTEPFMSNWERTEELLGEMQEARE